MSRHRRTMGLAMGQHVVKVQLLPRSASLPSSDAAAAPAGFTQTAPDTSCPPGYHWENDAGGAPVRGIAALIRACVPNVSAPAPAPATLPAAPPTAQPASCPDLWPLWWLLVAFGAGAAAGAYAKRDVKARRNAGRIVMNAGANAVARALGG